MFIYKIVVLFNMKPANAQIKPKILAITLGHFSGSNTGLFGSMNQFAEIVDVIDVQLKGIDRYKNLISSIQQNGTDWRNAFWKTPFAFEKMSQNMEEIINSYADDVDIIIQTQTLFGMVTKITSKPYYLYIDYTMKLAEREYPLWAPFSKDSIKEKWLAYESAVYNNAHKIFTFSDHTKNSLISEYGIEESNVVTVYAGLNMRIPADFDKVYNNNILFVGKDFERKGGEVLLSAFKLVKMQIHDATLTIAGASTKIDSPGVINEGVVTEKRLKELYKTSSVFAMPSLCEPFGIVFLEAMAYKCPCIGTDLNAMKEIIIDGETGFIVKHEDPEDLANKIILLLNNKNMMKEFGINSRKRVLDNFTWDIVAKRIIIDNKERV